MARGSGRDITLSLVTDTSRFDPDRAADDLDDLGRSADRTADAMRDLGDSGRSLRQIGGESDRASRSVGADMDEIREAGKGAAKELGGSFTGSFEDVAGAAQGLMAELGMAFGPAGMAAALAGALVVGAAMSGWTEETERAKEQIGNLLETYKALGQAPDIDLSHLKDFADGLDAPALRRAADDARKLGLSVQTVTKAWAGDAEAVAEVNRAMEEYYDQQGVIARTNDELASRFGQNSDSLVGSSEAISSETLNLSDATKEAAEAADAYSASLGGVTAEQMELNDALRSTFESIADASDDVEQAAASSTASVIKAAQEQADATESLADNWATYAAGSSLAAEEIIAAQEAQLNELIAFQANTQAVLKTGGEDLVAWANSQTDAAAAMAAAAKFTPEQGQEVASNYRQTMELAGQDMITGTETALAGTEKPAKDAGSKAGQAYVDSFVRTANSPANKKKMTNAVAPVVPTSGNPWIDNKAKRVP